MTTFRHFVFAMVMFRNISLCFNIVSKESLTWREASSATASLLSMQYIAKHGWDSLSPSLQENELYWIGARGDYTRFVSWEGCIERHDRSEKCYVMKYTDSGSISKCINKCKSNHTYFALQGSDCFCLSEEERINCTINSSKDCENRCFGNPNDFCGGHNHVMALYGISDEVTYNNSNNSEGNCLVLLYKNKTSYQQESCSKVGRRLICKGSNGSYIEDYGSIIVWQQAYDACRQKADSLYYNVSYSGEHGNATYFLTSLKRSFDLNWTADADGPRKCVAVTKTNATIIALKLENCTRNLRYIHSADNGDNVTEEKQKSNSQTILTTLLVIACIALFAAFGGLWFYRHQSKRKATVHIQPVYSVVKKPPREKQTTSRPANSPYYNVVEPGPDRAANAIASTQSQAAEPEPPVPPKYTYHKLAVVAQEEDSVYDTTSTSQNWNNRKPTRDGTIYGMRSTDNSYDSASFGISTKKRKAPPCPNYDEVAKL